MSANINLKIVDEKYKIQIGAEIYSLDYPSLDESQAIAKEFQEIGADGEKALGRMKEWLVKLGLDEKFFGLKQVKATHLSQIWRDVNGVKK